MKRSLKSCGPWCVLMPFMWIMLITLFLYSPYISRWVNGSRPSLTVFMWADIIEPHIIEQFEAKTGIKIYANYYEGNDELLAKLQFSGGKGYDIIMPTHYLLPSLIERGFLKPLDKNKITSWRDIHPHLMHLAPKHDYDYAVPLMWELYGLGIDASFFVKQSSPDSWHALFKPNGYRVGMTDEPREIINLAAHALFGKLDCLNKKQTSAVKNLLLQQKNSVEAYTDLNIGTLLTSGACPVILSPSSTVFRCAKIMPTARFILPTEGSVVTIENIAISAYCHNENLAYQFINFVLEPKNMRSMYETFGYLPAQKHVLETINIDYIKPPHGSLDAYLSTTSLITQLMPRQELYALWLAIKAY